MLATSIGIQELFPISLPQRIIIGSICTAFVITIIIINDKLKRKNKRK